MWISFSYRRNIIKNSLKKLGFNNFVEAENGEQAFKILEKDTIDFIISDWKMPVMDGYELLKKVRNHTALKDTPLLMITAEAERTKVIAALKAGTNNYIIKPFTPELLGEKINAIFSE